MMKKTKAAVKGERKIFGIKNLLTLLMVVVFVCSLTPSFGVFASAAVSDWSGAAYTGDENAAIADGSERGVDIVFQTPDYNSNSFACYTPTVNPSDLRVDLVFNNWNADSVAADSSPTETGWYALSILNHPKSKFSLGGGIPDQVGLVLLLRRDSNNSVGIAYNDEVSGDIKELETAVFDFADSADSRTKNLSLEFKAGDLYVNGTLAFSVKTSVDKLGTLDAYLAIGAHEGDVASLTVKDVKTDVSSIAVNGNTKKYIMFQMSNTPYDNLEAQLKKLQKTYGPHNFESDTLYAFGMCGPMLLTQSPQEMTDAINLGFDLALQYNIPVYFQIDDVTNYTDMFGSGAEKWYEDDDNVEKYGFGEDALRAKYWFNWGNWRTTPATACFNSPKFVAFIKQQIAEGIAPALTERYNELKALGKEYLFAGTAVGWETQIPDYTPVYQGFTVEDPPVDQNGIAMTEAEMGQTGYRALENLGYTDESLTAEATKRGIEKADLIREILTQVQTDYTTMIAKAVNDMGIPRTKIFTHIVGIRSAYPEAKTTQYPEISTAVNEYSTPGFTMNKVTCPYDIAVLKEDIQKVDPAQDYFINAEGYAAGVKASYEESKAYFDDLFGNGALLVSVFGYTDSEDSVFGLPKNSDDPFNLAVLDYTQSTPPADDNEPVNTDGYWIPGAGVEVTYLENGAARVYTESAGYAFESYVISKEAMDPTNLKLDIFFEDIGNMIDQDAWIVIQLSQEQTKFALDSGSKTNTGYGLMIRPGSETHSVELLGFNENGALDTYGKAEIPASEDGIYKIAVTTDDTSSEVSINGETLNFSGEVQLSNIIELAGSESYMAVLMHIGTGGKATIQLGAELADVETGPIELVTAREDISISEDTVTFERAFSVADVKRILTPNVSTATIRILNAEGSVAEDTEMIQNAWKIEIPNDAGETLKTYNTVVLTDSANNADNATNIGSPWLWICIIGVVIIAGIVILVIIKRKKSADKN
jgi:hypothetical protein